jgi:hypothetical protein
MNQTLGKYLALAGCLLGAATLLTQFPVTLSLSMAAGRSFWASVVFFFSFFTILSNILAVLCFAASVFTGSTKFLAFFSSPKIQTAVALYMLVVAVIYIGILEALWAPRGVMRVLDRLLHYVMPALFLIHWALSVPKGRTQYSDAARWLVFPFLYAAYVFIRGAITGEYPYPIMNAAELGYPAALRNTSVVLILFVFLGVAFVNIDQRLGRRLTSSAGS